MTQHRKPSPSTVRKHALLLISLLAVLLTTLLPAGSYAQEDTVDVQAVFDAMSVADRVGQLFVVSFDGNDPAPNSAIAALIRDYRIGGVVLDSANDNFRNLNADGSPANTPQQVISLTNRLQTLAFDGNLPAAAALNPTTTDIRPLPLPDGRGVTLPLLIGVQQEGDGYPNSELRSGYTPLAQQHGARRNLEPGRCGRGRPDRRRGTGAERRQHAAGPGAGRAGRAAA